MGREHVLVNVTENDVEKDEQPKRRKLCARVDSNQESALSGFTGLVNEGKNSINRLACDNERAQEALAKVFGLINFESGFD